MLVICINRANKLMHVTNCRCAHDRHHSVLLRELKAVRVSGQRGLGPVHKPGLSAGAEVGVPEKRRRERAFGDGQRQRAGV